MPKSTAWPTSPGAWASPWSPWSACWPRPGTASPCAATCCWLFPPRGAVTWRNHGKPEGPRYRDLLAKAKGNRDAYALRTIYLFQALILWLATFPVQAGMSERAPAGPLTVIGAVVWLAGFAFVPASSRPRRPGPMFG